VERMTGLDASFLYNETPSLHMHTLKYSVLDVSSVPGGYDFERFQHELERRLHLLPPFRRRVVEVPGGINHPVWIEDPDKGALPLAEALQPGFEIVASDAALPAARLPTTRTTAACGLPTAT